MNPDLLLIENNSSAHCCLKGWRLLSIPDYACKDGEAGGNRTNSDCNLWLAGNRQSAGADASAGACRDRASGRTPRPIFYARWRCICARPRQWEPRDSSVRYGRGFDDIQFEDCSDPDGFKNYDQHGERQRGGLPPTRWIHAGRINRAGGALRVSSDAIVGDFKFGAADGVVGLDVLSSFKSVTFDFKESMLILEDR